VTILFLALIGLALALCWITHVALRDLRRAWQDVRDATYDAQSARIEANALTREFVTERAKLETQLADARRRARRRQRTSVAGRATPGMETVDG
jgi:uncharacterized membrane protein